VTLTFQGKRGQVALDQLRAVDRQRLAKEAGKISPVAAQAVSSALVEIFCPIITLALRITVRRRE